MAKTSVMMRNRILMTHKSQARRSPAKFMNALLCIIGNVDWIDNWLTIRRAPRSSSTAGDRGRLDGAPEEEDRRVLKTPPARAPQAPILTSSNPKNNFRNDAVRRTPRSRRTCRAARPAEAVLRAPDRGARSAGLVARARPPAGLRRELLSLKGLGPETVDAILLYAGRQPFFVADAYTRRIMARHGLVPPTADYAAVQQFLHENLPADQALFNEFHALLVEVGKRYCKRQAPRCDQCPLQEFLPERPHHDSRLGARVSRPLRSGQARPHSLGRSTGCGSGVGRRSDHPRALESRLR